MECQASVKVGVTSVVTRELVKFRKDCMDVQKVRSDNSGLESAEDFSVLYGEKYENHKLETGFFVHKINQQLRE